jgi:hypothetical protein
MQSHYQENYYVDDMYSDDPFNPAPTPAPFKAEVQPDGKVFIKSADGLVIAEMCFTGHPENVVKDACLLAAAPALLATTEAHIRMTETILSSDIVDVESLKTALAFYRPCAQAAINQASTNQPDLFAA